MGKDVGEVCRITRNGVSVCVYSNEALHSFHLSLFIRSGSMHETEDESGISHFFEHAAIRNVNRIMDGRLYSLLDERGVEFNASTYSEMTHFFVGGATKNFGFARDVLLKVFSPIILDKAEIEAERARIKAEIRESDERTSLTAFTNGVVHQGTSLARSIAGSLGSVGAISKRRLEEYRKRALVAENIFFYVTGNVSDTDLDSLVSAIEELRLERGACSSNAAPVSRNFGKREQSVHIKNADFTMVRFTFDLDMTSLTLAETDIVYDALLSGYSSEIFTELSERRGLFYDVSGSLERYSNIGTLSFSFEVRSSLLYESVQSAVDVLLSMKRKLLPEGRCMRAAYVDNAYMLYDDPRELNFTFAYDNHIMNAGYAGISQRASAYSEITPVRVRELARKIFTLKNLTFTMKGAKKRTDENRLAEILSFLDSEALSKEK